ncbi:MAG: 16S rRNA (cytosine(1402)-N(4))-methyltransferase RsmH [Armatimonadetes bacterium]|nr:16S rRNA (cytosine(1402)-N(4))-methyltransferase RsmH [Armatimonadota bacterium]
MNPSDTAHRPVLVAEVLSFLAPAGRDHFADCSCGHGHFSERLAQCLPADARLLCLDIDAEAVAATTRRLARFGEQCVVVRGSYVDLPDLAAGVGLGPFGGIVIDAGCFSREQIMSPDLGLSFSVDGELNMKLDPQQPGPTARDLIATLSARELAALFREAGESPRTARLVASAIERARASEPLTRTVQLARVIEQAVDAAHLRRGERHPATRPFAGLRQAVNRELPTLEQGIEAAVRSLRPGGRLCLLSYYGTEHALVRRKSRALERGCICPPDLPVCGCGRQSLLRRLLRDPLPPAPREVRANDSARSARLHVLERTAALM